jgi:uncharacterized membrane-anchored protein
MLLRLGFLAVVALQVGLLLAILIPEERTLATGEEVLLQTVPVDPRDLFRGDYVQLRYAISTVHRQLAPGDRVFVGLEKRGETWEVRSVYYSPPEGLFIKGTVATAFGDVATIEYGIESYFVPEGSGHIIENARDVKVKVAVDSSGNAAIKQVLVNGEPFRP